MRLIAHSLVLIFFMYVTLSFTSVAALKITDSIQEDERRGIKSGPKPEPHELSMPKTRKLASNQEEERDEFNFMWPNIDLIPKPDPKTEPKLGPKPEPFPVGSFPFNRRLHEHGLRSKKPTPKSEPHSGSYQIEPRFADKIQFNGIPSSKCCPKEAPCDEKNCWKGMLKEKSKPEPHIGSFSTSRRLAQDYPGAEDCIMPWHLPINPGSCPYSMNHNQRITTEQHNNDDNDGDDSIESNDDNYQAQQSFSMEHSLSHFLEFDDFQENVEGELHMEKRKMSKKHPPPSSLSYSQARIIHNLP
jgi:hypothetical protein